MTATETKCEGCAATIDSPSHTYGPAGDTFCLSCWLENMDWIKERRQCLNIIFHCESELNIPDYPDDAADKLRQRIAKTRRKIDSLTAYICQVHTGSYILKGLMNPEEWSQP